VPKLPVVSLEEVQRRMGEAPCASCTRAGTNIVFGVGDPKARLMFVGEAPGEDEDLKASRSWGRQDSCSPR